MPFVRYSTQYFGHAPHDRKASELAALAILQHKGRVQDALADNMLSLRRHLQNEDHDLLEQLTTTTAALAKASLRGDPRMPVDVHRQPIVTLEQEREKLEIEIGTEIHQLNAAAGMTSMRMPLAVGRPSFRLSMMN